MGALLLDPSTAQACGCFTPPDPTVPIVQAGERIVFAQENGEITAHIQIQYSGSATEFGWLLPLPADPVLELGTDELFAQVIATTQPKYRLTRVYEGNCPFDPANFPSGLAGAEDADSGKAPPADPSGGVLVHEDSVGPYDYAVLRADSKQPMLDWLAENRYFVPAGTDDAVDPYIRPGAFFLALKLRKGNDVGDLQPVVVRYRSDLPMIPIVLTSVAADPNMGVLVWVLGEHRAIPRNYHHTMINDAAIDWLNFGANYVDVITRAVDEAPEGRSFVTEYAGTSGVMVDVLDYQGRFGNPDDLRDITDPAQYLNTLWSTGFGIQTNQPPFNPQFTAQLIAVLQRHLPVPSALANAGITANDYYLNFSWYTTTWKEEYPKMFLDLDLVFDPGALTDEIVERVVQPTLDAGELFRANPYLTRMFTTLSPEEMTQDPVFSFNPDLADVSNVHEGQLIFHCGIGVETDINAVRATLVTADGWRLELPEGQDVNPWLVADMPASLRTEILREEGAPRVVGDNSTEIAAAVYGETGSGGCSVGVGGRAAAGAGLLLVGLVMLAVRRRR
jgi:MYXO-CTERM domain-containing protein